MDNIIKLAISNLFKDKEIKEIKKGLLPGEHVIEKTITLHLSGTINKNANTEKTASCEIPWKLVLGILLSKMDTELRKNMQNQISEAIKIALESDTDKEEILQGCAEEFRIAEAYAKQLTDKLPKLPVSGATKIEVDYEVITNRFKKVLS